MAFAQQLITLRKQRGLSQEQLGAEIGVSRQTVSKWELGSTTPELDKLVALSDYFGVTLDSLVDREAAQAMGQPAAPCYVPWHYEYRSQREVWGLPLVHINFQNRGFARARGIIAIGNVATGLVAVGGLALGLCSLGGLSLGLIALGGVAVGLLLAVAGVAIGGLALGGVALGVVAVGGVALGYVAAGGCASGVYAVGELASGSRFSLSHLGQLQSIWREAAVSSQELQEALLQETLLQELPTAPRWVLTLLYFLIRLP